MAVPSGHNARLSSIKSNLFFESSKHLAYGGCTKVCSSKCLMGQMCERFVTLHYYNY